MKGYDLYTKVHDHHGWTRKKHHFSNRKELETFLNGPTIFNLDPIHFDGTDDYLCEFGDFILINLDLVGK